MEGTKEYWDQRYQEGNTGWDIGHISSPMKAYIDQLLSKDVKILVPGAGNAHEVGYLYEKGFKDFYALDISEVPFSRLKDTYPGLPGERLLVTDFFSLEGIQFDLILEQTFFCALKPDLRQDYAKKMHSLLREGALLVGLLFDFPLKSGGPPYGGDIEEYRTLFSPYFRIAKLERAYNSIPQRQGNELFFIFEKKTI